MSATPPYPPEPYPQPTEPQRQAPQPVPGFLSALFDLSFTKYVTIGFAQLVYVIAIVGVTITWLIFTLLGFSHSAGRGIMLLLLGWIPGLVWLLFIRLGIEMAVAIVRTAINTGELVRTRQL